MQNPKIKPRDRRNWSLILRRISQIGFVIFILVASVRHSLAPNSVAASIDALCPMGGLETLWQMIVEGRYIPKTHPSNVVLGIGLLLGVLLSGSAFCGWICPFGSLQDGLTGLRARLHLPEIRIPDKIDRWLRYGRFFVLGLILLKTISTVKLWFSSFDPYRTIFGLGWLFEFNLTEHWPAYLIALLVVGISFAVPRAWCKYACPLGGAMSLLGHLSLLRISRLEEGCKNCGICDASCPVGIAVSKADFRLSTNCIGCLECVEACPRRDSLEVQLAPSWWDGIRRLSKAKSTPTTGSGD